MTRTPAEQAAEALQKAKRHLGEWTPRYHFIDDALREIDIALAALTAEAGGANCPEVARTPEPEERRGRVIRSVEDAAANLGEVVADAVANTPIDPTTLTEARGAVKRMAAAAIPPDREALARELDKIVDQRRITQAHVWQPEREDFDASPEARAAALLRAPAQAEVDAMADRLEHRSGLLTWAERKEAAALLHRLSLSPAVGAGWRPIASAPKGDGDEGPELLLYGPSEHRPGFYIESGHWYRTCFTPQFMSGLGAPTHWQMRPEPPLPPAPEEAK